MPSARRTPANARGGEVTSARVEQTAVRTTLFDCPRRLRPRGRGVAKVADLRPQAPPIFAAVARQAFDLARLANGRQVRIPKPVLHPLVDPCRVRLGNAAVRSQFRRQEVEGLLAVRRTLGRSRAV